MGRPKGHPSFRIPDNLEPVVEAFFRRVLAHKRSLLSVTRQAGFHVRTMGHWLKDRQPRVGDLNAALNAIGYELMVRPMKSTEIPLPPSLAVVPNIQIRDQTIEQLEAERDYWEARLMQATSWGAAVAAAGTFRDNCIHEIERRRNG